MRLLARPGALTSVFPSVLLTITVLVLGLSNNPPDLTVPVLWFDKVQHAVAFFFVGYSYLRTTRFLMPSREITVRRGWAASAAIALGAILELLQAMVPYRTAEVLDLVADAFGVMIAVLVSQWIHRDRVELSSQE